MAQNVVSLGQWVLVIGLGLLLLTVAAGLHARQPGARALALCAITLAITITVFVIIQHDPPFVGRPGDFAGADRLGLRRGTVTWCVWSMMDGATASKAIAARRASATILKWQMSSRRARWPQQVENAAHPPPAHERVAGDSLLCNVDRALDRAGADGGPQHPDRSVLSARASPVPFAGPRRVRPAALNARELPPIDVILLSHNHYDHMDLPALRDISRSIIRRMW